MSGRLAQRCDQGSFNPGDNYEPCTACPYGLTTAGPGAGLTSGDCMAAKGFGVTNGLMGPCPIGEQPSHGTFEMAVPQSHSAHILTVQKALMLRYAACGMFSLSSNVVVIGATCKYGACCSLSRL
jgi:hypothetical protein